MRMAPPPVIERITLWRSLSGGVWHPFYTRYAEGDAWDIPEVKKLCACDIKDGILTRASDGDASVFKELCGSGRLALERELQTKDIAHEMARRDGITEADGEPRRVRTRRAKPKSGAS